MLVMAVFYLPLQGVLELCVFALSLWVDVKRSRARFKDSG